MKMDNKFDTDITDIIKRLPEDVQKHIYKEYLETKELYDEFKSILNSEECRKLQIKSLAKIIPKVLNNGLLIEYLYKKEEVFRLVYTDCVIKKKVYFENLDFHSSFALTLLMNLYH